MLNPEVAAERLWEFRNPQSVAGRFERAAALPAPADSMALALLRADMRGANGKKDDRDAGLTAAHALAALSTDERLALFTALLPQLGPTVEHAWQYWLTMPYRQSHEGPLFRAPRAPEPLHSARAEWLLSVLTATEEYEQSAAWYAAWAPYLPGYDPLPAIGLLLAGAMEASGPVGEEVFQTLLASARGEHEIGAMGKHVITALLAASRPEGWAAIESLLLDAQREEGLRLSIIFSMDAVHPGAFRRLLTIMLDHGLTRFPAVLTTANRWLGTVGLISDEAGIRSRLSRLCELLETPEAAADARRDGDSEDAYLGLWAVAFLDASEAVPLAAQMLESALVPRRLAALRLLSDVGLPEAIPIIISAADDANVVIAASAAAQPALLASDIEGTDLFERVERLLVRLPADEADSRRAGLAWESVKWFRAVLLGVLPRALGSRSALRLTPHLDAMTGWDHYLVLRALGAHDPLDADVRTALFWFLRNGDSRECRRVIKAMAGTHLSSEEAALVEGWLTTRGADVRGSLLDLLELQQPEAAVATARRLLDATRKEQRQNGVEFLQRLIARGQRVEACRALALDFKERRGQSPDIESILARTEPSTAAEPPKLEDGLGLLNRAERTPGTVPRTPIFNASGAESDVQDRGRFLCRPLISSAAEACLRSLDDHIHEHPDLPVPGAHPDHSATTLLDWWSSFMLRLRGYGPTEHLHAFPLADYWEAWRNDRPDALRDVDGLELVRALACRYGDHADRSLTTSQERQEGLGVLHGNSPRIRHGSAIAGILSWLIAKSISTDAIELVLDGVEATFSLIPYGEHKSRVGDSWKNHSALPWPWLAEVVAEKFPDAWSREQWARFHGLLRWMDEPGAGAPRCRPDSQLLLALHRVGAATDADIIDDLIGPRCREVFWDFDTAFRLLLALSGRKPYPYIARYCSESATAIVDQCRRRIIDLEIARDEIPTAATRPALALRYAGGMVNLLRILEAIRKLPPKAGKPSGVTSRSIVLNHLLQRTHPGPEDAPADFAARASEIGVKPPLLIAIGMAAPQWGRHVEHALAWPGTEEAIWWFHAHSKDPEWRVEGEVRAEWAAATSERTSLTPDELVDGAVDVQWFRNAYSAVGPERWTALEEASKHVSTAGGHKRAQLFARAMRGGVSAEELKALIAEKRRQDAVRALGLVPLPDESTGAREAEVLERYLLLQEFLRTSKEFGQLRRASEKLAVNIGMDNLARTAGYADPMRLQWAMEAKEVQDLAESPVVAQADDVSITLSINSWGEPELGIMRAGKPLQTVPAAAKKEPAIAALLERRKAVQRQAARMRRSLEEAMCRGDLFSVAELKKLLTHPVLAPMLRSLCLSVDGGALAGYPVEGGEALESHDGSITNVPHDAFLRIAHPFDLLEGGEWSQWQKECFARERIQPFKQIFRELYVLTAAERGGVVESPRYAGHEIKGGQALAILSTRGWVSRHDDGTRRSFHEAGIAAWLTVELGPGAQADGEGAMLEGVCFSRRGDWTPLDLESVPSRIFSEVMRDLDLVVSVAHLGGADPEASVSSIEMRGALVLETCGLLKLTNVRVDGSHVLIEGSLASYSIHLGSAVVHMRPGGALCIVPVSAAARGRIFLPFADSDPKSAELLSKVVLLARDSTIKDPTILQQILPVRR